MTALTVLVILFSATEAAAERLPPPEPPAPTVSATAPASAVMSELSVAVTLTSPAVVIVLEVIVSLVAAMGVMGLALAIVGLYGLVAYAASRRTKEIGIRMAIGARRFDVVRMVRWQGVGLAMAGLGAGRLVSVAQRENNLLCAFSALFAVSAVPS